MKRTSTALNLAFGFAVRISLGAMLPMALGVTVASCADENDPNTWVKKLDDPSQRAGAIKRLGQFYSDAMVKSGNKKNDDVKKLLDVIVDPLTKTYSAGGLDDKTRKDLIKELAEMRDARTAPAFAKALNEYELGKNDEDVKFAADGLNNIVKEGGKVDQSAADALWSCFTKYAPSKTNSIQGTNAIHDAVLAVKDPSYGPKATTMIGVPVVLDSGTSAQGTKKVNDQLEFWQPTAVQVLAALKYKPAAKPLVSALITRNKLGLALNVKKALLGIPNESVPLLTSALNGSDPDFAKIEAEWGADKGYVSALLDVLSYTSLPAARTAMTNALPTLDSDAYRAGAAQMLIWFPSDPKLIDTFKSVYAKLPPIVEKGDKDTGTERAQLLQVADGFYDPSLLPWVLSEGAAAKGTVMLSAKFSAISSSIKLMQPDQKKLVSDAIVNLEGSGLNASEKQNVADNIRGTFNFASQALDKCAKDAKCYVGVLDEPIPSQPNANWKAIKAAAMAGILGNDQTRKDLVAKLPKVTNPGARLAMANAINHLAPQGDVATADALDKIVQDDNEKKNAEALKGDDAVSKVAQMLRTRAGK